MLFAALCAVLPLLDVWSLALAQQGEGASRSRSRPGSGPGLGLAWSAGRLDCVRASEQCLKEQGCSARYRTLRQCVAGGREANHSLLETGEGGGEGGGETEEARRAREECRSALEEVKRSPLYGCRCKRGMKKEKNCLRIYWGIYQTLQGNDFLEDSPYEPVNGRMADIFRLAPILSGEPALTRENSCLNAAKACNLNDTCKKYRSAYISPCTSRVSTAEVCNRRKCHKALRQFFDKVPAKHAYGMLFCSCGPGDRSACSERRRQTIVPVCSYEERDTPNCLSLQAACKTNYICRSRLADFFSSCVSEPRSPSGCLKDNYSDCLLAYSGLIGTVMTPNYLRAAELLVSPFCDCSSSGNSQDDCSKLTSLFTHNSCLRNAIQAFGNGTELGVWPPVLQTTPPSLATPPYQRPRPRDRGSSPNAIDDVAPGNNPADHGLYHFCGNLQAQKLKTNLSVDGLLCVDPQIDDPSPSINSGAATMTSPPALLSSLLPPLVALVYCTLRAPSSLSPSPQLAL